MFHKTYETNMRKIKYEKVTLHLNHSLSTTNVETLSQADQQKLTIFLVEQGFLAESSSRTSDINSLKNTLYTGQSFWFDPRTWLAREFPIHRATKYNNFATVRIILRLNIDSNLEFYGQTALQIAIENENFEIAKLLIIEGNQPKQSDVKQLIEKTVSKGHLMSPLIELLVQNEIDIDLSQQDLNKLLKESLYNINTIMLFSRDMTMLDNSIRAAYFAILNGTEIPEEDDIDFHYGLVELSQKILNIIQSEQFQELKEQYLHVKNNSHDDLAKLNLYLLSEINNSFDGTKLKSIIDLVATSQYKEKYQYLSDKLNKEISREIPYVLPHDVQQHIQSFIKPPYQSNIEKLNILHDEDIDLTALNITKEGDDFFRTEGRSESSIKRKTNIQNFNFRQMAELADVLNEKFAKYLNVEQKPSHHHLVRSQTENSGHSR